MKGPLRSILLLAMALCMLLSGCHLFGYRLVPYRQMEYTRPDMVTFESVLDKSCAAAVEETDIRRLEEAIFAFYDVYDQFYTNLNLSMISYSRDMTDIYWEGEYQYCLSHAATADAGLDRLYRCLAKSPLLETLESGAYFGPDYFDSFQGESIYDEQMLALLQREAELCSQYQAISADAANTTYYSEEYFAQYGNLMAQVFLELVQLRQEMAVYAGYDSYPAFAYDFCHVRDYTPQQATGYLADIRAELVPLYRRMIAGATEPENGYCSQDDTVDYVRSMAQSMGGLIGEAFSEMSKAGVYELAYGENTYAASYEIYLSSYATPYIFVSGTGTEYDKLTFAHEFGHFCSDYAVAGGSIQGVDVAEVFSQAMEYLSLSYADGGEEMRRIKLTEALRIYVEQAAYASFEHQVYSLTGDELTVEGIRQLYADICTAYGMDLPGWDSRDYVCNPHFFTHPMYVISYVLSNDAAFQIYEMELNKQGSGLALYEQNLASDQAYFLSFLQEAGLESPFATGRLLRVRQTLEQVLK